MPYKLHVMETKAINLTAIYFSATDTTRRCVAGVATGLGQELSKEINLADDLEAVLPAFSENDVVIVAFPVYGGRLPMQVSDALQRISGNNARVIAMVVYGNRDYDDALLELTDILRDASFRIVGQGAFIGQHSISPAVGALRPDDKDLLQLREFGEECRKVIDAEAKSYKLDAPKGNRPYKKIAGVPVHPKADEADCKRCGICADKCPVGAIPADRPFTTDNEICISCGRCIYVCSNKARRYSGITYNTIGTLFKATFSKRKSPSWTVATPIL